jgi:formylglycine-generating enzyme required for sulfatase activity
VDPGTANQYAIYDWYYTGNPTDIAPVGYAYQGAGLWGQLDMAGEVWEWNVDGYANYTSTCIDCAYLSASSSREFRGGCFAYASGLLPPGRGYGSGPTSRDCSDGFRCARTSRWNGTIVAKRESLP